MFSVDSSIGFNLNPFSTFGDETWIDVHAQYVD